MTRGWNGSTLKLSAVERFHPLSRSAVERFHPSCTPRAERFHPLSRSAVERFHPSCTPRVERFHPLPLATPTRSPPFCSSVVRFLFVVHSLYVRFLLRKSSYLVLAGRPTYMHKFAEELLTNTHLPAIITVLPIAHPAVCLLPSRPSACGVSVASLPATDRLPGSAAFFADCHRFTSRSVACQLPARSAILPTDRTPRPVPCCPPS